MKPRIVVCASGEGTNFEAIVKAAQSQELRAVIVGLIASRPGIGAIARAERLKIPVVTLSPKAFTTLSQWDSAVKNQLSEWRADWVALAGFLCRIGPMVLQGFPGKIVNSHPALLPKHGGAGMYGRKVHAAVLAAGDRETGVTIHLIDEEFDQGKIIAQQRIAVRPDDSAALLEARVKDLETAFYPRVLNDLVTGRSPDGTP